MSLGAPHNLQCPHCGNEQETMVYDSINVTVDPELKTKLLAAEINMFDCAKCGKKSFINTSLLYHDMSQQFCVQYFPAESLENPDFFNPFNADGSLSDMDIPDAIAESSAYIAKPHIVFDISEMINYVIFRDGLARNLHTERKGRGRTEPFEGCYRLPDGTYSDEGFFENEMGFVEDENENEESPGDKEE